MLWIMSNIKLLSTVAGIAALGIGALLVVDYIRDSERNEIILEQQSEQIEKRKKIDEAVLPSNTPDVDSSLQYLESRESN